MKNFLLAFICVVSFSFIFTSQDTDAKTYNGNYYYTNFSKKELLSDLSFSEMQIFDKTYNSDSLPDRLERLEIAVYGAIQDGQEDFRIKKLRKSITNVSSGGNGLQYTTKILDLAGNAMGTANWAIGNMHNFSQPYYSNSYYGKRNNYSHRLPPPCHCHSHRLPPPPPVQNYNYNPITNGDFSKNYSIGTTVRILDD